MQAQALRRIIGFNLMGAGIFLLYGAAARRGAAAGFAGDPVPHALVITGVVVAFSATALAVALVLRLADADPRGPGEGRRAVSADWLLVLLLMLPVMGVLAIVAAGEARAEPIALGTIAAACLVAALTVGRILAAGQPLSLALAGLAPPLGLGLRADGPSAVLLTVSAVVMAAVGLYAAAGFRRAERRGRRGRAQAVRVLVPAAVAVERAQRRRHRPRPVQPLRRAGAAHLRRRAAGLPRRPGRDAGGGAALPHVRAARLHALSARHGDPLCRVRHAGHRVPRRRDPARPRHDAGAGGDDGGLLAKAALVPLHLWLPPAHSGAPPAASAVLSALVVKAPFFLLLRLWFEVAPGAVTLPAGQLLGGLGGVAVLLCGVLALRQVRLKLLIAYSTAAQIGYLFLVFALRGAAPPRPGRRWRRREPCCSSPRTPSPRRRCSWPPASIAATYGHDRIAGLDGFGRVLPVSALALALGGLSLIGLPPSGGFNAKWLLMGGAVARGHWAIAVVILAGGLLAAGYVLPLIRRALAPAGEKPAQPPGPTPRELPALALALAAISLGLMPLQPLAFLAIGHGAPEWRRHERHRPPALRHASSFRCCWPRRGCCWPGFRARAIDALGFAPLPGLLCALFGQRGEPFDLIPALRTVLRLDDSGAILLGGAALLWSAAGFYAAATMRRDERARRFRRLVAADAGRQPRRLHRRRRRGLLSRLRLVSLAAYGLIAHDRHAAREPRRLRLHGARAARRGVPAARPSSCWRPEPRASIRSSPMRSAALPGSAAGAAGSSPCWCSASA